MDKHEMYYAGHMIEVAVTYYKAAGKRMLLNVSTHMVDHMMTFFGLDKRRWVPGHEETELVPVRLAQTTGGPKYVDFANWLLEQRGHGYGTKGDNSNWDRLYYRDEVPVSEMESTGGRAVRCMYLCCGMADVAAIKHNPQYIDAFNRLWTNVVERNMYITGGIGSSRHNKGLTEDYDLPNLEAYCETCASVDMVLQNHRTNQFTDDSKYINVLEHSMHNGALAGISLNGDRFLYVNPLGSKGDYHRLPWYGYVCCSSQLSRFFSSIGNYIYGISDDAIRVNLYTGNVAEVNVGGIQVTMKEETRYPWNGKAKFTINADEEINKELRLRIPGWCKKYNLLINGKKTKKLRIDKGYIVIADQNSGDNIELDFDMPVEVMKSDVRAEQSIGKCAIQRGPLAYCIEDAQNKDTIEGVYISPKTPFKTDLGVNLLNSVQQTTAKDGRKTFTLIPYYVWGSVEAGSMKVWIDYKKQ